MAKARRNIGLEILEGVRQLKRGEHGRIRRALGQDAADASEDEASDES